MIWRMPSSEKTSFCTIITFRLMVIVSLMMRHSNCPASDLSFNSASSIQHLQFSIFNSASLILIPVGMVHQHWLAKLPETKWFCRSCSIVGLKSWPCCLTAIRVGSNDASASYSGTKSVVAAVVPSCCSWSLANKEGIPSIRAMKPERSPLQCLLVSTNTSSKDFPIHGTIGSG